MSDYIEDGFGSFWKGTCENCGSAVQVVRPGKAQCSNDCGTYPVEVIDFTMYKECPNI